MSIYHLTHALYYNNDRMYSATSFSGIPEILIKINKLTIVSKHSLQ